MSLNSGLPFKLGVPPATTHLSTTRFFMQITDPELLEAIWQNQLKRLSRAVLSKYVGGRYGLVNDADFWFKSASSEHRISRSNITEKIGSQQLLKRLSKMRRKPSPNRAGI
jgi:hypothetical protein